MSFNWQIADIDGIILLLIAFFSAFFVTFITIPAIRRLSQRRNIYDIPDERKVHTGLISRLGGVGIFAGVLASSLIWLLHDDLRQMSLLLVAFLILFIVGLTDDLKGLSPRVKLAGQVLAAFIVAHTDLRIESLSGILGIYELPLVVQYAFTIFLITGVINALNLIDGIDGLAAGLSLISAMFLSGLIVMNGDWEYALMGVSVAGALVAFLRYNYHPAAIFMGDTGSLILGFALAVLGVRLISFEEGIFSTVGTSPVVILVFGSLLVPVYDTLRVFIGRIMKKQSPFTPDKTHIHHLIIQLGYNHALAAKILYGAHLILIISSVLMSRHQPGLVVFLLVIEAILLTEFLTIRKILLSIFKRRKARNQISRISVTNRFITEHYNRNK